MSSAYLALNLVKATTDKAEIGKQLLAEIRKFYSGVPAYEALPTKSLETVLKEPTLSRRFALIKSDISAGRSMVTGKLHHLLLEYDAIVAKHAKLTNDMSRATAAARTPAQAAAADEVMERTLDESAATRRAAAAAPGSLRTTAFRNGFARGDYGDWNGNNNFSNNNSNNNSASIARPVYTGLMRGNVNLIEHTGVPHARIEQLGQRGMANIGRRLETLRTTRGTAVPRKSRNARHRKQQKTRRFSRR